MNIECVCDCGIIIEKKIYKIFLEKWLILKFVVYVWYFKENVKFGELICEVNNVKYLFSNGFLIDNKWFDILFWIFSLVMFLFNNF